VNQEDVAWDLISFTQAKANGSLGITRGNTAQSTILYSNTWASVHRTKILVAINEVASRDGGFEWEIDANKLFRTYYPQRGRLSDVVFEYAKNVPNFGVNEDAFDLTNALDAIGKTGTIRPATDSASQLEYGLLEDSMNFDVVTATSLQAHADEELRVMSKPRITPNHSVALGDPLYGGFDIGDTIRLRADVGFITFDESKRIETITINVSKEGKETPNITYSDVTGAVY
jgi:hypothetical protein